MGSVEAYETSAGRRYRARYRDPDHRSREKGGFRRKVDAEQYLAAITVSASRGEYIDPSDARATIGALGDEWLRMQTHLKPSTFEVNDGAWRTHVKPKWGERRIGEVRHSEVQQWVSELSTRRSATVTIRAYGILAAILDVAVKDRRLSTNVARGVKLPRKVKKQHTYLTHQQVHALAGASGEHGPLILLLAYTGLRWGEVTALRVEDLDMLRWRISISKNAVALSTGIAEGTPKMHKNRSVPFPKLLLIPLARQCEGKIPSDLVFPGPAGGHRRRVHTSPGSSRSWFITALDAVGLESMTFHDLRHTAASLAVSSGANVKAVQRMLGHASAAMTLDTYADLFDDDLDAVADRLDEHAAQALGHTVASLG